MLYCEKRKLAIFLNPKTGTQTIYQIFKDKGLVDAPQTHYNYTHALKKYNLFDFKNYKFFCFYRDPVSRFESAIKFLKRDRYLYLLLKSSPNEILVNAIQQVRSRKIQESLDINRKHPDEYFWLSQEIRDHIESLSIGYFYDMIPEEVDFDSQSSNVLFAHQTHWLDHDIDITYLNFSNFEVELQNLLFHFDLQVDNIPKRNATIKINSDWTFSPEEVEFTKDIYKRDYDFLLSKGLL